MNELKKVENILNSLLPVVSVSGDETKLKTVLGSFFEEDIICDTMNSLKVHSVGVGKRKFLIDAHIDQIGFVVTDITENGFLKLGAVGGIDVRTLRAADVTVHTLNGDINGVIVSVPPHLMGKSDDEAPQVKDVLVDIGTNKDQAESAVKRGDIVSFNYFPNKLLNNRIASMSLDNKAGAAVLVRTYQILKDECPQADVTYLFSSQEEAGMRGAKASSYGIDVDEAIVVDVSFATSLNVDKTHAGELDKGPMICISPVVDKAVSDGLTECAKTIDLPYQIEICSSSTGTNADVISLSGNGIKTGLVSVPLRNMHTFSEVISLNDVESSARLIAEYIKRRTSSDD